MRLANTLQAGNAGTGERAAGHDRSQLTDLFLHGAVRPQDRQRPPDAQPAMQAYQDLRPRRHGDHLLPATHAEPADLPMVDHAGSAITVPH
jgi:hypothetical protein